MAISNNKYRLNITNILSDDIRAIKFRSQMYITFSVFFFLLLYTAFCSPLLLIDINIDIMSILGRYFYGGIISLVVAILIKIPLFSTDALAHGKSKYSKFFKEQYPSRLIEKKYNVDQGKANFLWFNFYNKWAIKGSKYRSQWGFVTDRTYGCRFIFYISKALILIFFLSLISIIFLWWYENSVNNIIGFGVINCFYPVCILIFYLLLKISNKVPKNKPEQRPTGCWKRYQEISQVSDNILKQEILNDSETFKDAIQKVEQFKY